MTVSLCLSVPLCASLCLCEIVLTVIDDDDVRDQFLGQAVIALDDKEMQRFAKGGGRGFRHSSLWRTGGTFTDLPLGPLRITPKTASGVDVRVDTEGIAGDAITGTIDVQLEAHVAIDALCSTLMGQ